MNAALLEPVRWSRRRWIYTVAALFFAQTALVLYLGQGGAAAPPRPLFRTDVYLAADEWSLHQLTQLPDLSDPLLLALPSLRGFSGQAWLKFPAYDYAPEGRTEPPRWLPLEASTLGQTFSQFVASNQLPSQLTSDKPLPPLVRYEPNFPNDPPPQHSRLRIDGGLAGRPLVTTPQIKSWPHSEMLSNTTVQAVVDAEGFTVTVKLLAESGLRAADLHALELAADARFQPLPRGTDGRSSSQLTWGRLTFLWHTLPSPATNLSSGPPRL
jgi:hypothetical protein